MEKKTHKCPSCGKMFGSKAGLKQHEHDKHVGVTQQKKRGRRRKFRRATEEVRSGINFDPTGSALLIPRGNPSGLDKSSVKLTRPTFGPTTGADKCHKFIRACRELGCTLAGAIFALKNVHPNCDDVVEFQGIPDEASGRIFPIEIRTIHEVNSTVAYDCGIITRWAPNESTITTLKATGASSWADWTVNSSSVSKSATDDILRFRVGYGGMTCYLSASANQTEGMVYCANRLPEVGIQINTSSKDKPSAKIFREISGKWDPGSMFSGDPGFFMDQAYRGAYGRTIASTNNRKWISVNDSTNTQPTQWVVQTPDGVEKDLPTGNLPDIGSIETPDISNVYTVFDGLDPKAKIIIKTRVGYELMIKPDSLAAYGLRFSPDHDPVAMEITASLLRGLPSGVPSSENDLSSVLDSATGVLFDALSASPNPIAKGAGYVGNIIKGFFK